MGQYNIHDVLLNAEGFEWDEGNINKNWIAHQVSMSECEEVFFNEPLVIDEARPHPAEYRYAAFGKTNGERLLAVVFTVRGNKIRVISARDMSKKERKDYDQKIKKDT